MALYKGGKKIQITELKLSGDLDERLFHFSNFLDGLDPDAIVVEEPYGVQGRAIPSLYGMLGLVRCHAYRSEIPFTTYSQSEIKKSFSGKGGAGKEEMVEAARAHYDVVGGTHNEADALAVLDLYLQRTGVISGNDA